MQTAITPIVPSGTSLKEILKDILLVGRTSSSTHHCSFCLEEKWPDVQLHMNLWTAANSSAGQELGMDIMENRFRGNLGKRCEYTSLNRQNT